MSEQVVTPSQGIGEQQPVDTTTVATTPDVNVTQQGVTQEPVQQQNPPEPEVDVNALITKIRYQEEEIERQRLYAEFLKGAQQQEKAGGRKAKPEFDPDGVPLFSEVDEYIEYKLAEEREKAEEERLIQGLEEYGRKAVVEDPNFKERATLAGEMLQYNPANMQIFLNERTVEGKIKIIELLAQMHPRYNPSLAKGGTVTAQPTGVDQAIEKLKATSQMPPTLTGLASASPTTKLYSQMSPEEILRELENVKRQA